MDIETLIYAVMKSALLMVMLFGAYLSIKQIPRGKVKRHLVGLLLFWAALLVADIGSVAYSVLLPPEQSASPTFLSLVIAISSQLVILWMFYNLLFSTRRCYKILALHVVMAAMVMGVGWLCDGVDITRYFQMYHNLAEAYRGIETKTALFKVAILMMQLIFTSAVLVTSRSLVPVYQRYIEQNESNPTHNLLWIREVSHMLGVVTAAYIIASSFNVFSVLVVYYVVVIVAYMHMINIFLQHNTLDNLDDMYDRLGVKWNWRRMWYVDEVSVAEVSTARSYFFNIINWISSERPYTNPDFSFKDLAAQFPDMGYSEFDALMRDAKGVSFQAYMRECRIEDAIRLMSDKDKQLRFKEIAHAVGFDNNSSFSRAFKAVKGVSASEWRATV